MRNPKTGFMMRQETAMTNNQVGTNDGESRNVRIAKLLGYTVRYWYGSDTREHWDLLDVDGAVVGTADTEAEAWQYATDFEHDLSVTCQTFLGTNQHIQVVLRFNIYAQKMECMLVLQGLDLPHKIRIPAFAYSDTIEAAAAEALENYLLGRQQGTRDAD